MKSAHRPSTASTPSGRHPTDRRSGDDTAAAGVAAPGLPAAVPDEIDARPSEEAPAASGAGEQAIREIGADDWIEPAASGRSDEEHVRESDPDDPASAEGRGPGRDGPP